jgi:hypothetical protein
MRPTFRQILWDNRSLWDHEKTRPAVRVNFEKLLNCRTLALGAEVYASDNGERKVVPHTCKSRTCPSCGWRATLSWQNEIAATLPDISYAGICLTMPDVFWQIFQQNRHLQDDLPVIGAGVLEDWAEKKYGASVMVLVVPHTFNSALKFNSHLHILVSTIGLHRTGSRLISDICFPRDAIQRAWRHALLDYLTLALKEHRLLSESPPQELTELLQDHRDRWWSVKVDYAKSRNAILEYISRYLRRPPLAEYRLLSSNSQTVSFLAKDKKLRRNVTLECSKQRIYRPMLVSRPGPIPAWSAILRPPCSKVHR